MDLCGSLWVFPCYGKGSSLLRLPLNIRMLEKFEMYTCKLALSIFTFFSSVLCI